MTLRRVGLGASRMLAFRGVGDELAITRIEHGTRSHLSNNRGLVVGEAGLCLLKVRLASHHHSSEALLVSDGLLEMLMCG